MKAIKTRLVSSLLLCLLAACAPQYINPPIRPTTTPPPVPSPTASRAGTPTVEAPTPTSTAGAFIPVTFLKMIDENNGWAWANSNTYGFLELLRTTDGGQTWTDVSPYDLNFAGYGGYFLDAKTAWVQIVPEASGTADGLAHTTNGGKTWTVTKNELPFVPASSFHFLNQNTGWAQTIDVGAGNAYIQLYRTQDSGVTWHPIIITPPEPETNPAKGTIHLCNICGDGFYYDPSRAVITYGDLATSPGGAVRLAISTNLGKTWKNLKLPLPSGQFRDRAIAPLGPTFFDNQDAVLPVLMEKDILQDTPSVTLAIYSTTDGGLSWKAAPATLDQVSAFATVDFVSPKDAFVACGDALCVTHDGAQSWQSLKSSLSFDPHTTTSQHVSLVDFISAQTGWAVMSNDDRSVTTLWKTTNGGVTWILLSPTVIPK